MTDIGRDFRPVLWTLISWGNKHFSPEGPSVVVVNAATGENRRAGGGGPKIGPADSRAGIQSEGGSGRQRTYSGEIRGSSRRRTVVSATVLDREAVVAPTPVRRALNLKRLAVIAAGFVAGGGGGGLRRALVHGGAIYRNHR